jgi:hypothetical protein
MPTPNRNIVFRTYHQSFSRSSAHSPAQRLALPSLATLPVKSGNQTQKTMSVSCEGMAVDSVDTKMLVIKLRCLRVRVFEVVVDEPLP